jgi:hypothetical protein
MESPDLKALFQMINELQQYASRLGLQLSPEANRPEPTKVPIPPERSRVSDFLRTGDAAYLDNAAYIDTYVGLSVGEHEEVADANYQRQRCRFVFSPGLGRWVNDHDVHFPPASAPHGCDAIIIEGRDVYKKLVARMGSPVMLGTGNACGYLKGSLGVNPDQMRKATWVDVPAAGRVQHAEPPKDVPLSEMFADHLDGYAPPKKVTFAEPPSFEGVKVSFGTKVPKIEQLSPAAADQTPGLGWTQLEAADPVPTEEPPVNEPAYCDRCERVSLVRRNQLASLGYQVSHLVELPDEAGYAVPCPTCRTR